MSSDLEDINSELKQLEQDWTAMKNSGIPRSRLRKNAGARCDSQPFAAVDLLHSSPRQLLASLEGNPSSESCTIRVLCELKETEVTGKNLIGLLDMAADDRAEEKCRSTSGSSAVIQEREPRGKSQISSISSVTEDQMVENMQGYEAGEMVEKMDEGLACDHGERWTLRMGWLVMFVMGVALGIIGSVGLGGGEEFGGLVPT